MTYEEAYRCICINQPFWLDTLEEEAYRIVKDICQKADKYRWHDLRNNSNDLPDDFHTVLICIDGFEGKAIGVSMAMHNRVLKIWGTESTKYKDYEVIAWKEIEPFEVME